tara:strand:- start:880 stop:3210 length:2331 start_codon:yes stop_codon:yes gene_type:complete
MPLFGLIFFSSLIIADDSWMVYDDSSVARVDIYVDSLALEWMYDYDNVESDSLHMAYMYYQNEYINDTLEQVGFRLRGNTSRTSQKKSFKLDFNHFVSGRDFYSVEKINLNGEHNDVSIIRSKLSWDIFESIEMVAPRANHIEVYINDNYYGLYISVEHIDDSFLSKNFSDDTGNLWKCLWPANLGYRGSDPNDYHPWVDDYRPYDLKTNDEEYDFTQLARLIHIINNDPDSLEHVLDVSEFIKYLAINILTGGWDDYRSLQNNFYLYHQPNIDRFLLIPYDYDNTFGVDWFSVDWDIVDPYSYYLIADTERPLADIIFDNEHYRNLFSRYLQFYIDHVFNIDEWGDWIDNTKEMIDSSAYYDTYRTLDYGFTYNDFTNSFSASNYTNQHIKTGLKEFIINRVSSLEDQIEFSDGNPLVYKYWIEPKIPLAGDSITIHAAAYGYPDIQNINLIVHNFTNGAYNSYSMDYEPVFNASLPEELEDHWVITIPPILNAGNIGIRFLSTNTEEVTGVSPQIGEWMIRIASSTTTENIFINEFLAKNNTVNVDEFSENDDWLELYNNSSDTINLHNHYLSDDLDNLTKWKFSDNDILVAPNDYLLIWCDNDESQGVLHTNFKLSGNGEFIALTNPDGVTVIDTLAFGEQLEDISFGRFPDGSSQWIEMSPSPGYSNIEGLSTNNSAMIPNKYYLYPNYPNPFNPITSFVYDLPKHSQVKVSIYNTLGREIKTLVNREQNNGSYIIQWDGNDTYGNRVSSGVYLYHLNANSFNQTRRMILLK